MNLTGQKEEEQFMRKRWDTAGSLLTAAMTFGLLAGCQTGGTDSGEIKARKDRIRKKTAEKPKSPYPSASRDPYFSAMEKGGERAAEGFGVD